MAVARTRSLGHKVFVSVGESERELKRSAEQKGGLDR